MGAIAASLASMPLMLKQLGPALLGAWLVLLSVFQWVTFFDLGVASGARNEIARALANGDIALARRALVTGWCYTVFITLALTGVLALGLATTPILPWLRGNAFGGIDATSAVWVVSIGACVSFALSYIQPVFAAFQRASAVSMFSFLVSALFLGLLVLLPASREGGMVHVGLLYLTSMLIAHLVLIVQFFLQHPQARVRLSEIDHGLRSRIVGFGMRLFAIQIAAMVIFTLSRLLVSIFFGAAQVVVYDGGFRIFSVVTMVHTLVMSTLWSTFTQAYEQGDWAWMRKTIARLQWLMVPVILGCAALAALAPWLIEHWLGRQLVGGSGLYVWFAVITALSCWSNIFAYFVNGIGDVSVQFYSAIAAAVINVPASYFFAVVLGMGISGVLAGTVASLAFFSLLGPWQVARILARK